MSPESVHHGTIVPSWAPVTPIISLLCQLWVESNLIQSANKKSWHKNQIVWLIIISPIFHPKKHPQNCQIITGERNINSSKDSSG